MSRSPEVDPRLRRRARRMRVINVPMRLVLRLPFPTPINQRLMLLSYTGRRTGRAYLQPVSFVRHDGALLTPAGGRWKLNLRDDQPIHLRLRGRDVLARPEFVRNPEDVERLLNIMIKVNPRLASFVPVAGSDGHIDGGRVQAAIDQGFAIIRWHLDQAPRS